MDKKAVMQKEMKKWEGLNRLANSEDYQQFLKPILEEAFHNTWMDPNQLDKEGKPIFSTYEAFHKAYTEQYGRAIAFKELFNMLSSAGSVIENYAKQINNPDKNYGL